MSMSSAPDPYGHNVAFPSVSVIRISGLVAVPISILATFFRLYLRARKRILWWDDFWAALSCIGMVIFFAGLLLFTDPLDFNHSRSVKIAGYYMIDTGFYSVIWFARVSIMLTVVRLAYGRFRQMLVVTSGVFCVFYLILMAQAFWVCEPKKDWKDLDRPQCMLGAEVAITQLVTDILSDLALIAGPTWLLWNISNKNGLKIRLIAIFSSTILTTIASLAHAYALLKHLGLLEFFLCVVELCTSLIVVNLAVLATWAFKLKDEGEESDNTPHHVNTFLRGRLSGKGSSHNPTDTAFALRTFGSPDDGPMSIRVNVDTLRQTDQDDHGGKKMSSDYADVKELSADKFMASDRSLNSTQKVKWDDV